MKLEEGRKWSSLRTGGGGEQLAEWQREWQDKDKCIMERRELPTGTELQLISASFKSCRPGCSEPSPAKSCRSPENNQHPMESSEYGCGERTQALHSRKRHERDEGGETNVKIEIMAVPFKKNVLLFLFLITNTIYAHENLRNVEK